MNDTVDIIGVIGNNPIYTANDILRLLNTQQTHLLHGDTFTGRPGTKIHIEVECVLKIRSEIQLDARSAKLWAMQTLEKERLYSVYHPHKTWFVVHTAQDNIIGNICPRLQPLHNFFTQPQTDKSNGLSYLNQLFDHYFRLASLENKRLDEGLSNFGITQDGKLYYLDDDMYTWDRFITCAQMLGVYFRSLSWITTEIATEIGKILQALILKYFDDAHCLTVLTEQLKDIFLPNESQQSALQHLIKALQIRPLQPIATNNLTQVRYLAILADIHANLPALEVVLNFLKIKGIQQGIVLGDIIGYGPHPSQCIKRIQETQFIVLKGNHDHALATNHFKKGFSSTAAWALEWSMTNITEEQKIWLENLPPLLHTEKWLALHGAPIDPTFFNAYVYEMTYQDNLDVLQRKKIPLCFHGHTHQPGVYGRKGVIDKYFHAEMIDLKQFHYALVCPGSIGQPRNGELGAQFAIYDQQENKVYYHTLLYNLEDLLSEMQAKGFPKKLMAMLKGDF